MLAEKFLGLGLEKFETLSDRYGAAERRHTDWSWRGKTRRWL